MKNLLAFLIPLVVFSGMCSGKGWFVDLEGGMAFPGYNDVQVPGDSTGTRFSLSDELDIESEFIYRIRAGYETGKHSFSVFAAPLRLEATGTLAESINFAGETFPQGEEVEGLYRFDSYRLTWRYLLGESEDFLFKLGFTAKIRDAEIRLESAFVTANTTNTGFVPLLSFEARWNPAGEFILLMDGDALVGPVGRAEDIFLGGEMPVSQAVEARAGYRIVEGGADVETVYNFTLVNFVSAGLTFRF